MKKPRQKRFGIPKQSLRVLLHSGKDTKDTKKIKIIDSFVKMIQEFSE